MSAVPEIGVAKSVESSAAITSSAAPVNAFIPKGIQLATRADRLFKFGSSYAPVLELTHKDGHVEITGIKRENWRMASRGDSR